MATAKDIIDRLKLDPADAAMLLDALPDLQLAAPRTAAEARETLLERWDISAHDLTKLVDENGSLRGMLFGYVAEFKFAHLWLDHPDVSYVAKPDDHNRKKKGDRHIIYKGNEFTIEVKSLQTNMVKRLPDGRWAGKAQCDGSDRRIVRFADGTELNTTCLLAGQFDVLAINCFGFDGKWEFAFARNVDLPRSAHRKYTPEQRQQLLATLVPVTWPPEPPFYADPFLMLDRVAAARATIGDGPPAA